MLSTVTITATANATLDSENIILKSLVCLYAVESNFCWTGLQYNNMSIVLIPDRNHSHLWGSLHNYHALKLDLIPITQSPKHFKITNSETSFSSVSNTQKVIQKKNNIRMHPLHIQLFLKVEWSKRNFICSKL